MLRRIGLSNFKCWRELDIELAPITLLFGTNSSGKSAILQSLLMLKQTVASRDPKEHLNFGGGPRDFVDFGGYHDLVNGHETEQNPSVNLSWDLCHKAVEQLAVARWVEDKSDTRQLYPSVTLQYEVAWSLDRDVLVEKLAYRFVEDGRGASLVELKREEESQYRLTHFVAKNGTDPVEYILSDSRAVASPESCHMIRDGMILQVAGGHVSTSTSFIALQLERLLYFLIYLGPIRQYPKRQYTWSGGKPSIIEPDGTNAVEMLISSSRDDNVLLNEVQDRLMKLDLVNAFNVKSIDKEARHYEATATMAGVENSLTDVGFGVSQVLPVITMLMSAPEGSIVLLEQPELHLHPNAQAALADLMLEVAENRNLQLIVESHSEHIVRRLQRRIAEASPAFATPEHVKMYYCQPGEGGATIDEVDVDRFGQIANWPEKFMGDISGDIHSMSKAAFKRLHQERVGV